MQIHVARNSAQLGIFAPEEITAGLQSGRFLASDLAWREGMPSWTPLGDWSEFREVGVPPSSPGATMAVAPAASTIPWEQGKSLGSFFATIQVAIMNPSSLATGRYAFGDWVIFCYFSVLISLPFQLISILFYGNKNAQLGELLSRSGIPTLAQAGQQLLNSPQPPLVATLVGAILGLAIAPFVYALFAVIHWVGQRLFKFQVSVERTTAAALLATSVIAVLMAPIQLLGFSFVAQMTFSALLFIPVLAIYFRIFGAATRVSPLVQFGISCFVWFVLCCCCCVAPASLIGMSAAKAFAH
jgi:hypothetical protein